MEKKNIIVLVTFMFLMVAGCSSPADTTDATHSLEDDPDKVVVYFFWGDGCPHCADEKPFLEELEQKHPELEVKMFETWNNPDNVDIFRDFAQAHGFEARAVPTTLVGEEHWVGYSQAMGKEIENKINDCIENDCPNPGDNVN